MNLVKKVCFFFQQVRLKNLIDLVSVKLKQFYVYQISMMESSDFSKSKNKQVLIHFLKQDITTHVVIYMIN